jgi:tetratricopeptide (TPR) repeat protein
VLTANIQPDGLQQGDVIVLATTDEHADPILGTHVEANFGQWGGSPVQFAHVHLEWPASMKLNVQAKGFTVQPQTRGGSKVVDVSARDVQPIIAPKGAPSRFTLTRFGEATDFASWSEVGRLMDPLFRKAETIPATGPLHDEIEKIRASTTDPKLRAAKALQLVQDRVRYVALLMGQGSYVPADAETTWSRRFGDCKAKTALLLGILRGLGVEAEPLLVQSKLGDAIPERLPMLSYFDHVLVRAHVAGKTYYLDGTRTGDTDLDGIEVPDFVWGLPLIPDVKLVSIVPPPRQVPDHERRVEVDASGGVYAPAAITLTETYRGDSAVQLNSIYSAATAAQRDEALRKQANDYFDGFAVSSSSLQFDKAKREYTILIKGTAKLNWRDGWFFVPTSSIAFNPDLERPAGPLHDAPIAVNHPRFARDIATIKLPPGFAAQQKLDPAVRETLAGVDYARTETVNGDSLTVESSERSLVSEIPYKDALAAAPRLKSLSQDDAYLRLAANYRSTPKDLEALAGRTPASESEYLDRGNTYLDSAKFEQAIADFTSALSLNPKSAVALADRGIAYTWLRKFDLGGKDLEAALSIDPSNAVALRGRGLAAEISGDCASAIEAYTKSLQGEPGNNFAVGHRAICENILGKHSEALADAELALNRMPQWSDLRLLRVDSLARLGQRDSARQEAELFVKENPQTSGAAWVAVAQSFARVGMSAQAIDAFDKALAIKPEPSLYVARAGIRPAGDYGGRLSDLNAALKLEPTDSGALAAKADLLTSRGDLKSALAIYDKAMKASPGQSPLSLGRAIILYKLGRKSEAERALVAWRQSALTATELNELCWKKATAGILLESAAKDCDQALRINPNYAPAIDSLALVKLRLGKFDEAIALYDRAIAKMSAPASYMGRALAYARKGDKTHADADVAQALKLDPNEQTRFEGFGLQLEQVSAAAH